MPDGEGSYLFRRLKQHPLTENIPVVVLTGQTNPAVKRQLLSVGVAEYLLKPLVFSDLLAVLNRYVKLPTSRGPHCAERCLRCLQCLTRQLGVMAADQAAGSQLAGDWIIR